MKKSIAGMAMGMSLVLVASMTSGCGKQTETVSATDGGKGFSAEEIQQVIEGMTDRYVMIDAQDMDYLFDITYDNEIVTDLTVDDSEVKTSEAGTYEVTYTATVDVQKMEEYLAQAEAVETTSTEESVVASDEEQMESGTDNTEETPDTEESETVEVSIEKEVEVVTEEKAQELIESGETVWNTGNEQLKKEETQETTETTEDGTAQGSDSAQADTNSTTGSTSASGTSTATSSGHVHSYTIPITETRTRQVETSPATTKKVKTGSVEVCNSCGMQNPSDGHLATCGTGGYHVEYVYETVTTPATYTTETYTVTTGYKCSCGAVK